MQQVVGKGRDSLCLAPGRINNGFDADLVFFLQQIVDVPVPRVSELGAGLHQKLDGIDLLFRGRSDVLVGMDDCPFKKIAYPAELMLGQVKLIEPAYPADDAGRCLCRRKGHLFKDRPISG